MGMRYKIKHRPVVDVLAWTIEKQSRKQMPTAQEIIANQDDFGNQPARTTTIIKTTIYSNHPTNENHNTGTTLVHPLGSPPWNSNYWQHPTALSTHATQPMLGTRSSSVAPRPRPRGRDRVQRYSSSGEKAMNLRNTRRDDGSKLRIVVWWIEWGIEWIYGS